MPSFHLFLRFPPKAETVRTKNRESVPEFSHAVRVLVEQIVPRRPYPSGRPFTRKTPPNDQNRNASAKHLFRSNVQEVVYTNIWPKQTQKTEEQRKPPRRSGDGGKGISNLFPTKLWSEPWCGSLFTIVTFFPYWQVKGVRVYS